MASMQAARLATRLQRELRMLQTDPPPGVCAWPCNEVSLSHLEAQIQGPEETVYEKGIFKLEVRVPERYPFEPPNVRFKTPIYHPNIDSGGRICLDILNMPPKGAWKPSLNIPTILASIGLLLAEPNPDDGLMGDITAEYKHNRASFDAKAKKWTEEYALENRSDDEPQRPQEDFHASAGEHETSTSGIETTRRARDAHHFSFGLSFSEERGEEVSRGASSVGDKLPTASMGEPIRGPASGNQKLNLSMKLSRGKGATSLERKDTAATETPLGSPPLGDANSSRSSSAQQNRAKSTVEGIGLRETTSIELAKPSGASSSATDAPLQPWAKISNGLTNNLSQSFYIKDAQKTRQVPLQFSKLSATSAIDLCKDRSPGEDSTNSAALSKTKDLEFRVTSNGETASPVSTPVTKANSMTENGRIMPKKSSLTSSKCPQPGYSPGISETDNLSNGTGNRLSGLVVSAMKSSSYSQPNPLNTSAQDVETVAAPIEIQRLSSNLLKRLRDESANEGSVQQEIHHPSGEMKRKLGTIERITTGEIPEVLDKQVRSIDHISREDAGDLHPMTPREEPSKGQAARLGLKSVTLETSETSRESGHITSAASGSAGILEQKKVNTIHVVAAHASPVLQTTNSTAGRSKVGAHTPSVTSKYFRQENADVVSGKVQGQVQNPSKGNKMDINMKASQIKPASVPVSGGENARAVSRIVQVPKVSKETGNKIELTKKLNQIDLANLIVLDSESDEEPPKARSRLSLAHRKGIKRK